MNKLTVILLLLITYFCASIVTQNVENECEFGTEMRKIYNYYRCKCNQEINVLNNNFVRNSCTRTSFWSCNGCGIKRIDEDTFNNLKIYVLFLNNNNISELNWLEGLPIVEEISLQYNDIQVLNNDTFANQPSLYEVDLSHNNISAIESYAFRYANSLTTLNLSYNSIDYLPKNLFRFCEQLTSLNVSHNRIESINISTFDSAISLSVLDLSYNRIKSINSIGYFKFDNLHSIDLNYNRLYNFAILTLFEYAPNLQRIEVDGNEWDCSYLMQLINDMKEKVTFVSRGSEYDAYHVHGLKCNDVSEIRTAKLTEIDDNVAIDDKVNINLSILNYLHAIHVELIFLILIISIAILLVAYTILRRYLIDNRHKYVKTKNEQEPTMDMLSI